MFLRHVDQCVARFLKISDTKKKNYRKFTSNAMKENRSPCLFLITKYNRVAVQYLSKLLNNIFMGAYISIDFDHHCVAGQRQES